MGYGRCRGASFPPDPKLGRRRRPEATPVPNITWPEPAARSLTLAATIGGVSKKKVHWFWRPAAGGPEPEANTGRPAVGVAVIRSGTRDRHLPQDIPAEAGEFPRPSDRDLSFHHAAVPEMPPRLCRHTSSFQLSSRAWVAKPCWRRVS